MGASFSTRLSESNIELRNRIDAAATKVVLDSSFTDLTKLANEKYCNRLVKKVATIFQQNKDTVDLELLRQKLYDEMQKEKQKRGENSEGLDDDADLADAHLVKTSEKHNKKIKTPRIQNVEKKCIQISKFYVLFAHLFSCIVSTINPTFKIEKEKTATSGAAQKEDAKSTAAASSLDFCSSRIDALVNGELVENSDGDLLVKPNVCKTNVSKSGSPLHLIDLPGMKALQQLYKDANANDGDNSEKEDARYLFKAFMGKDAPDHIRRLDQVPLKAYNKDEECKEQKSYDGGDPASDETQKKDERRDKERREVEKEKERERERMFYFYNERDRKKNEEENARTGVYLKGIVGSLKERLFTEYVQHIKEMIERAEYNRSRLLEILSEMFTYTYGSGGSSISGVIINPSLTYKKLQSLVVQTRRIVIKLYTDCEEDYKHGLDIFFAMVQEKIAMKLSVQEEVLKKQLEDVMYGPPERYIPDSLLYQQQFQGAEDFNKKQFVPPHFKSSVISIVKKGVPDTAFQQILPSLNEWMNEEIENATSLLDPKQVADDFLKENVYGDDDEYGSSAIANDVSVFSSPSSSPSASAIAPAYASASASTVAPYAVAPPVATPSKAKTSFSKIATDATTSSKLFSGPSVSPSPRKVKTRALSDIQPRQLSFISEE